MGWLGEQYFQAHPGEADYRLPDGRMVNRAFVYRGFDHFKAHCTIRAADGLGFCLSHWLVLYDSASRPKAPELTVPCGHCPSMFESKGAQKTHMQKAHKDVLEAQRRAYMAERGLKGGKVG